MCENEDTTHNYIETSIPSTNEACPRNVHMILLGAHAGIRVGFAKHLLHGNWAKGWMDSGSTAVPGQRDNREGLATVRLRAQSPERVCLEVDGMNATNIYFSVLSESEGVRYP